jgi:glycosyltransferase involved in cell wall biosynthesis
MIIGIDITMLVYTGSGVANYTYNLVKNLLELDKKNEYRLFYSSLRRPPNFYYLDKLKNLGGKIYNYRFPPTLLQIFWGKLHIVPVEWFIGKVDIFFSSDFLRPPLYKNTKGITTIHDLTWKLFKPFHEQRIIEAHEKKLEKTIQYGDEIIVDSISTKYDLLKLYPQINKYQVHVIYPGISERFQPIKDEKRINEVLKRYKIHLTSDASYLLYVGAIEPRKNLDLTIELFNELIKKSKFNKLKLLIVGRAGWKNENTFQLIYELDLKEKVKFVGFVKDEDLPYFYSGAKLTVYLSSYEGFGIPPLESLACGTPVLAGDNSSLKETLPQKFLVDVENKGKILEKMNDLLKTKHEINSDEFKKRFQWKESAKRYLEIISGSV